ncbi:hypothetical protein BJ742DRAFT_776191 [Cladochytrium replicatum]|nr:hypothetical protein BJ742DRAFT_776191 [Cladochytrium replicatum]
MDCNEFVQPGITETTPKSAPGELLTTSGPISIMSMLDQLSNRIKEPRMEWITREDGMLVCTLCTGKDHSEYKERDALRKHCRASHPAKEGLGTNPRVHTEEFLRDAFEVAGLLAAGQEGVDMVLRILQGTVKRDKNSLNNDSYEEDLAPDEAPSIPPEVVPAAPASYQAMNMMKEALLHRESIVYEMQGPCSTDGLHRKATGGIVVMRNTLLASVRHFELIEMDPSPLAQFLWFRFPQVLWFRFPQFLWFRFPVIVVGVSYLAPSRADQEVCGALETVARIKALP